jgi:hypothetical protein
VNLLALPRPRVVDRRTQFDPHTIPDPDFRFERGDVVFEVVYGPLPQDPPYYALSPKMPLGTAD